MTLLCFQAHATHTSKPIVTTNNRIFIIGERIAIGGWTDYFGQPISDVLLDIMLRNQDGTTILRELIKSDSKGSFTTNLLPPKEIRPGYYFIYIISECRVEHRDICENQDVNIPIEIVSKELGDHAKEAPKIV